MRSMALALALAAVVPAPTLAEEAARDQRPYLVIKVAVVVPQSDDLQGFDDGLSLEAAVGFRLSRNLGVELGGGRLTLDRSQSGLVGGVVALTTTEEVVAYPIVASLRVVAPGRRIELFALVGGGVYFMSGELEASAAGFLPLAQTDSDTPFAFHVGGGFAFSLTPRVRLGAEAKYLIGETDMFLDVFGEPTSFDSVTLGATLAFSL